MAIKTIGSSTTWFWQLLSLPNFKCDGWSMFFLPLWLVLLGSRPRLKRNRSGGELIGAFG